MPLLRRQDSEAFVNFIMNISWVVLFNRCFGTPMIGALLILLCFCGGDIVNGASSDVAKTTPADFDLIERIEVLRNKIDSAQFPISEKELMDLLAGPVTLVPIRGSMKADRYVEDYGVEGCDPSFGFLAVRMNMERVGTSRVVTNARLVFLLYNGTEFAILPADLKKQSGEIDQTQERP